MKFIGKHLNLIGILFLTVLVGAAAGLYFDLPARLQTVKAKDVVTQQYTCPMHPDVVSAKPGKCPKCGMALVPVGQANENNEANPPGCCANMSATEPVPELRLPPGHPPIPGWTTNTTPKSESAPSNTTTHSSHRYEDES